MAFSPGHCIKFPSFSKFSRGKSSLAINFDRLAQPDPVLFCKLNIPENSHPSSTFTDGGKLVMYESCYDMKGCYDMGDTWSDIKVAMI
jgi:hypothetical protein